MSGLTRDKQHELERRTRDVIAATEDMRQRCNQMLLELQADVGAECGDVRQLIAAVHGALERQARDIASLSNRVAAFEQATFFQRVRGLVPRRQA
jgi:uncharacterized protein YhaN